MISKGQNMTKKSQREDLSLTGDGLGVIDTAPLSSIPSHHIDPDEDFDTEQEALDQQDVMIKGIAHDVNNNLMAIMAACDQLETRHLNPVDVEIIISTIRTHISSSSTLMRNLVDNRDLETPLVMSQTELRAFFKQILPSLSLIVGEATQIELGSVVTPPVHVHPLLLHRIMMQFIRNVDDLDIDHPLAFISVRRVGNWCEVSVSDNGPGLMKLKAEDVFKPGVSSKGNDDSRGYGLSAVAWAVNTWSGEYGVEAIEGDSGCRFWVRLPIEMM
jgi:K+-sensing histidine kinase KdpD